MGVRRCRFDCEDWLALKKMQRRREEEKIG
jgi:hypothetical protein